MITTYADTYIADKLALTVLPPMLNIAIGTGTPSAKALGNELSRRAFTVTRSGAVAKYTHTWDIEDQISGIITEMGIFDSATLGGNMLLSKTFSQSKGINDQLTVSLALTINH